MFPAPAPTNELPPQQNSAPPDGEAAKAKAREMKSHEAEVKAKALKEGKKVDGDSPLKPANVSVPQVKQPSQKADAKGTPKAKQKGAEAKQKGKPAKPKESAVKDHGKGGKQGANEKGAKGDIDAEVRDYLAKAPKDESKREIHANVKQLADAASNLAESAPAPKAPDGAAKSALKALVPGADTVMAALDGDKKALADSDLGKMVGAGENPYAQFDGVLKTWGSKIYRVRNFLSGASSLLGKVGTVLTVIGVLISITGIGAPLGAPIATIGRVLGVITLVMDAINFILSGILTGLLAMELAKEPPPDPAKVQKLAGQLLEESANTFQALLSVGMALPGVQKLAGMVVGGAGKLASGLTKMVGKFLGKVGAGAAKGLGKMIAAGWNKLKTSVFKATALKSGPGFFSKIGNVAKAGLDKGKALFTKGKDFVGRTGSKLIDKINNKLELKVKKFEETAFGKGLRAVDKKVATPLNDFMDKYTGKTLLDKAEKSAGYYATKMADKVDGWGTRLGEGTEGLLNKGAGKIEQSAQREAAENLAKQQQKEAEKRALEEAAQKQGQGVKPGEPNAPKVDEPAPPKVDEPNAPKVDEPAPPKADETAAPKADEPKPGGDDWKKYQEKRQKALKRAEDMEKKHAATERQRVYDDAKDAAATEKSKLRNLEKRRKQGDDSVTDDMIEAQKQKVGQAVERRNDAAEEFQQAQKKAQAKEVDGQNADAASDRASRRLNENRGNKDADGNDAKGLTDAEKRSSSEFADSQNYKDPNLEKPGSIWGEKVGDPRMISKTKDQANNDSKADAERRALELLREQTHEQADAAHDSVVDHVTAPSVPGLDDGGGGGDGGLFTEIHGMLGSIDEDAGAKNDEQDQNKDESDQIKTDGNGPKTDDQGGGDQPKGDQPKGDGDAGGGSQKPGAIPYWPELLEEYQQDIASLGKTREALQKYRQAQIDGYKAAVGIKDAAQGQKEKAQKTTKEAPGVNKQGLDNDKTLSGSGKAATETGGKASQGQGKESEAGSAGQEGASAAGTEVPDPPAPNWWDHILNAAKKFICNYIGKALKWVQDWFTNAIISLFTGGKLNLDKVNAMAKGVQQGTSEDANKSRQSAQQADQAGSKSQANEAKADEEMTEAQKLQQECQKNVAAADDLLKTVDEVEALIKQEIEQGTKWLAEVKAAKEKEKQDLAAKEAQKQKEQEEKEKEAAKKAQDAANKKDAKDKDQASPEQMAKLSQAAQAVTAGSAANHQKVLKGFEAAKGALKGQGGPGDKQMNHEAAESAIQVFEEHGREAVSNHQTEADQVKGKMAGVVGKGQIKRSELHGVVQEIEGAAKEADQTLGETLQSLKKAFDASYRLQKKQAHKKGPGDPHRHQAQP